MSELRTNRIVPRDGLPAGSAGGVIQVVHQTRTTSFTTTNTAYQDFMSVSITPTRSDSKMLVRYGLYASTNGDVAHIYSSSDEIWRLTYGAFDAFFCSVGSGGTVAGYFIGL